MTERVIDLGVARANQDSNAASAGSTYGLEIEDMPDLPRTIEDRQGYTVDVSGPAWSVFGAPNAIRVGAIPILNPAIRRATVLYLIDKLKSSSPTTAYNSSAFLLKLNESESFVEADSRGKTVPGNVVREVGQARKVAGSANYMNYEADVRSWYIWCAEMGFPYFDPDVANELEMLVIGGNPKGLAVLSNDPNKGPLSNADFESLRLALQNEERVPNPVLNLIERCLVWLFLALGLNPKNVAFLHEEDLVRYDDPAGDDPIYVLRVPRIKKRGKNIREDFKERKIHPFLGRLLEQLIEENRLHRQTHPIWQDGGNQFQKPLFMLEDPDAEWLGTDAEGYAWHYPAKSLGPMLKSAVGKLRISTALDPSVHISVTPRRLRYTFATRLVKEGASPQHVAEALDHSDLQHVMVYFNVRSDMVNFLDRANPRLAAVAQMFVGTLIDDESEAERGHDPSSRLYPPPATRSRDPLGNCGHMGYCGLHTPIACYTCRNFRPWKDGPHRQVYDFLMDERQRKIDAGADIKNIQIHEPTIRAVARVIELCEDERVA